VVSKGPWKHRPKHEAKRIAADIAAVERATGRHVTRVRCPDGYEYVIDGDGVSDTSLELNEWDEG
jgi:hypothetical protein